MDSVIKNQTDRVLLLGAGGMLGLSVFQCLSERYAQIRATDIDVNEPWLSYLDVRDLTSLEAAFRDYSPTIVVNLAALTDLEFCERNPEAAWATNALGAENAALLAEQFGATLVYISTAGIYDGRQEFYTDFDLPNPLSYYAKSKYHGELFVERRVSKYFIFRAGWMMGSGPAKDKKFINKIYRQIRQGARELFVVADKLGTPTYTKDFAYGIAQLLGTRYYGLYNQVCTGSGSRLDVAREFVRLLGLENEVRITQVSSDYFKTEYFAPRPESEKLINLKLNLRNLNHMRDWKDALADYATVFRQDLANQAPRR